MKQLDRNASHWTDTILENNKNGLNRQSVVDIVMTAYREGFKSARYMAAQTADDWMPDETNGALGIAIMNLCEEEGASNRP